MPGHVARLVTGKIPDPQALLKPFPVLPQGMSTRSEEGGSGLSELRKGPEGIPLILPREAGAQRVEVTHPESHNCLEI